MLASIALSACGGSGKTDSKCTAEQALCGTECKDVQTDALNCGQCGTVCSGATACFAGVCLATCGDGKSGGSEGCDDGNKTAGDGCSGTCGIESGWACMGAPSVCTTGCGDGIVAGMEACDDGNTAAGDGCSAACAAEVGFTCSGAPSVCMTTCGDGVVGGSEACDEGNTTSGDGCAATCAVEMGFSCQGAPSTCAAVCGDGAMKAAETCDDGNTVAGDGCSDTCRKEPGFLCAGMPSACTAICGDGLLLGGEACDDQNTTAADGCDASCDIEQGYVCNGAPSICATVCGDGILAGAEACDDANTTAADGCDGVCAVESGFTCAGAPSVCATTCGDGITAGVETCDDANTAAADGCDAVCATEPGYLCSGAPSVCLTVCGDGILAGAESCDDANTTAADGCDASCAPEAGFTCTGAPSVCTTTCGDGIVAGAEACDDANTSAADGCNALCAVETGFTCAGAPSVCATTCGDGITAGAEGCDDGNTAAADGCSAACAPEAGFTCTGAPSTCATTCGDGVRAGAELCDDGNTATGDCCNATCSAEAGCEIEPNNSDAAANAFSAVSVSGKVNGFLSPSGSDVDVYSITLTSIGLSSLIAETRDGLLGLRCVTNEVDTFVTIRNSAGATLVTDDDTGEGRCSLAVAGGLAAGQYFVEVKKPALSGPVSAYSLALSVGVCGNAKIELGEACDDGNTANGDGCTSACKVEAKAEVEPNATPATGTALGVPGLGSGSINPIADKDHWKIVVPPKADLYIETFDAQGPVTCTGIDTVIRLYDTNGTTVLATDDEDGVNSCSRIDPASDPLARNLAGGTYFVYVEDFLNNGTLNYTLVVRMSVCGDGVKEGLEECDGGPACDATCQRVAVCGDAYIDAPEQCDDGNTASSDGCSATCVVEPLATSIAEVEPNNTTVDADARATGTPAVVITGNLLIGGAISALAEKDVYRVNVSSPTVVRFETFGSTFNDCPTTVTTTIRLLNSTGVEIPFDTLATQTAGIRSCSALVANLAAGTYYLQVEETGNNGTIASYQLEARFHANGGNEVEVNDANAQANALAGSNVYVFGGHQTGTDSDVFAITIGANKAIRAEVIEGGAETCELNDVDSRLTLYDIKGTLLVEDDDDGRGFCSQIDGTGIAGAKDLPASALPAGTYFLQVRQSTFASATGGQFDYRLVVTVR